jgi:hypothetical protein
MSNKDSNEVSLAGQPIYRHSEPTAWQQPEGEACIEQISDHIEEHLGKIESVFHEIVSDTVHIDVHWVKPNADYPFHRLITSGMSDLPMQTPEGAPVPRFVELMMTLPPEWKIDQASFEDEKWYWPVRELKFLARLPHKYNTWLGFGHTVPNGDPPEPFAPGTKLCGAILVPSVTVPEKFHCLRIDAEKEITFYAVVPLHESEMNLKLNKGIDELLTLFGNKDLNDVVDAKRADVTKKKFGLF